MMKEQSLDFIVGSVFARVDRDIYKHFAEELHQGTLVKSYSVPKIWFGLTSCHSVTNDIVGSKKYEMIQKLTDAINDLYPELETVCEKIVPENQYLRFDVKVKRREVIKKMTISDIEKELGYKVEIVSDK